MMIHYVNSFNNNIRFKYTSSYSLSRISRISRQMSSSDEDLGMISKVYHYYQYYSFFKYNYDFIIFYRNR